MSLSALGDWAKNSSLQGSCSQGGDWHFCPQSPSKFIGCCLSDPCTANGCPNEDVKQASLGSGPGPDACAGDSSLYPNVQCPTGSKWYTCFSNVPSFQGCCAINPCERGSCPHSYLFPASFKTEGLEAPSVNDTCLSTKPKPAPTVDNPKTTPTSVDSGNQGQNSSSPNLAAIIGGSIAGLIVLGLLIFGIYSWYRTRKSRAFHKNERSFFTTSYSPSDGYRPQMFESSIKAETPSQRLSPQSVPQPYNDVQRQYEQDRTRIHEIDSGCANPVNPLINNYGLSSRGLSQSPELDSNRVSDMSQATAHSQNHSNFWHPN